MEPQMTFRNTRKVSGTFDCSVQQALHLDFSSHVEMTSSVYKMWLVPGYLFRGPYPSLSPYSIIPRLCAWWDSGTLQLLILCQSQHYNGAAKGGVEPSGYALVMMIKAPFMMVKGPYFRKT